MRNGSEINARTYTDGQNYSEDIGKPLVTENIEEIRQYQRNWKEYIQGMTSSHLSWQASMYYYNPAGRREKASLRKGLGLSQFYPLHALTHFFQVHFNIILQSTFSDNKSCLHFACPALWIKQLYKMKNGDSLQLE